MFRWIETMCPHDSLRKTCEERPLRVHRRDKDCLRRRSRQMRAHTETVVGERTSTRKERDVTRLCDKSIHVTGTKPTKNWKGRKDTTIRTSIVDTVFEGKKESIRSEIPIDAIIKFREECSWRGATHFAAWLNHQSHRPRDPKHCQTTHTSTIFDVEEWGSVSEWWESAWAERPHSRLHGPCPAQVRLLFAVNPAHRGVSRHQEICLGSGSLLKDILIEVGKPILTGKRTR